MTEKRKVTHCASKIVSESTRQWKKKIRKSIQWRERTCQRAFVEVQHVTNALSKMPTKFFVSSLNNADSDSIFQEQLVRFKARREKRDKMTDVEIRSWEGTNRLELRENNFEHTCSFCSHVPCNNKNNGQNVFSENVFIWIVAKMSKANFGTTKFGFRWSQDDKYLSNQFSHAA